MESMDRTDTAANACVACKQYKRKCNKALPSCSTCSRLRRACNYSTPKPTQATPEEEIMLLRARVEDLEKLVEKSMTATNKAWSGSPASPPVPEIRRPIQPSVLSSLFFLDERYFTHLHSSLQPVLLPVPDEILSSLKDEYDQPQGVQQLVARYFDAVHSWMPIISKMRMKRVMDRPIGSMQADAAFLVSCMKLLHTTQTGSQPEDLLLYRRVKALSLQLEIAGLQSLILIQGGLLIAVYELGHGIYPAAYTTVAQCARQAISLGIHNREAPQFLQPWPEWEEEIRVWWFVVMLDRHVTVGRELRPLCTEDPKKHAPLPADSEAWDQGAMGAPERLYISSPATSVTSPYARLAQAFNLLGRVIRHCNDQDQDLAFILEEMSTLHQAISALLELARNEESQDSYVATAVCLSSLMKLHKNFLHNSFHRGYVDKAEPQLASRIREYTEASFNTMRDTALQTVNLAQLLERHFTVCELDKLSPLALHCLYRAGFWLSYLAATNREERFLIGRSIFDRVLKAISLRWKVADTYLEILETVYRENRADY